MILRRVMHHVKKQEWTAIGIDFVIVVIGVFVGIQVSNWNAELATEKQAAVFTERLREDLRVEAWRFKALNFYYDDILANAVSTLDGLEGRSELSNSALLIAAYRATQYGELVQYRATYDELTSTGNIGLINDPALRKMAAEIYSTKLYENVKNEGINSRYRIAFRMLVPMNVQKGTAMKCGDKPVEIGDYKNIKNSLDYDCTLDLSQQDIDRTALLLRSDPALVPLLRLRIADINSAVSTRIVSSDVLNNLETLAQENQ